MTVLPLHPPRHNVRHRTSDSVTVRFEVTVTGDEDAVAQVLSGLKRALGETPGSIDGTSVARGIVVDPEARSVTRNGENVPLTYLEFDLLLFLASNPRRLFSRADLLEAIWHGHQRTAGRTVDVHVRRLRAKLGDAVVATVRQAGYRLGDVQLAIAGTPT
jgi:two-component system, OmpR family, response regulator